MENESLWRVTTAIPQLLEASFIKAKVSAAKPLSWIQWPLTVPAPHRAFRYPIPPAGNISTFPSISENRYGEGTALYVAAPVFSTYWDTNHYWVRTILNNLLEAYDAHKPFEIEAPTFMETSLMRKDDTTYLHLVNFQNNHTGNRNKAAYDPIEKIWPVHGIRVRYTAGPVEAVRLLPEGTSLPFQQVDSGIEFIVPEVHIHTIVELK